MSPCRYCDAEVIWATRGGRKVPLDPVTRQSHYCAQRERHPMTDRTPKENEQHIVGRCVTGESYVPSCGECTTPPWEACACSARLAA